MTAPDDVAEAARLIESGEADAALALLRRAVTPQDRYAVQARLARGVRALPLERLPLRPLKIALVASFTVDYFKDVLALWLVLAGIRAEFHVAPFDTVAPSVMDEASPLYAFAPDLVWLMTSHRDLRLDLPPGAPTEAVHARVAAAVEDQAALWRILAARAKCVVLQNNADIPAYDPFGNLAGAAPWGGRSALRLYNFELAERAAGAGVILFDLDHVSALFGKASWVDARHWHMAKTGFTLEAAGLVASHAARLIAAAKGLARKCLVLDLDNTLWGGVIGDDGLDGIRLGTGPEGEAFVAFQAYVQALGRRGVVLAVSSKNDEKNAVEPFEKHPDMRLQLADIAVFRANWDNKPDNIRAIAGTLNLGLDAVVFVDDNPAEREAVRQLLPMVEVPELAADPADYIASLATQNLFEATLYSAEDGERARLYRENAARDALSRASSDLSSYLANLAMRASVGPVDAFTLPRMAQLINKSNQFHLTGTRYAEAELAALAADPAASVLWFRLADRFGDNGLISVVILKAIGDTLDIDTWVMSCRVLGRTMEEFIANEIRAVAQARSCARITGHYRPSAKNGLVAGLYARLGFAALESEDAVTHWQASSEAPPLRSFVERVLSA